MFITESFVREIDNTYKIVEIQYKNFRSIDILTKVPRDLRVILLKP